MNETLDFLALIAVASLGGVVGGWFIEFVLRASLAVDIYLKEHGEDK